MNTFRTTLNNASYAAAANRSDVLIADHVLDYVTVSVMTQIWSTIITHTFLLEPAFEKINK